MNIEDIRKEFPFFNDKKNKDIVYLDSAATTQKPKVVLDSLDEFYTLYNANANRGAYKLAVEATRILEESRKKIKEFINANRSEEIIFTKSATESLNLISYSYGLNNLKEGDEVLISVVEHHSNLVNWKNICDITGAKLKYFYLDENLNFDINDFNSKINENTKIVSFTAQSNVLSFSIDAKKMIETVREKSNAVVVLDACQAVAHKDIDVKKIDCDFLVFSGHKIYSSTGVGVLYGKYELLDNMKPFLFGGDMIEYVREHEVSYQRPPHKFEAGTMDISAIYSLSKSIDYINKLGIDNIKKYEEELVKYCYKKLKDIEDIDIYYPKENREGSIIAFNIKNIHPHDVSQILDYYNINIRVGHHCAQVLHRFLGINSSCRVSISFYNTYEEIDKFIEGIKKVKEVFYGN